MSFFNKIKKAFESKNEDVESQKDEIIDKLEPIESIRNNDKYLNENEEIQSNNLEEIHANKEVIVKPTPTEKIRNFKYLDDLIHSRVKEIVLDSNIVLQSDEESQYLEGIKLDVDDLTIDGKGHTIDAQGLTRIFYCTGKNIIIKNIILKNGFSEDVCGAIYNNNGELTITKSTLNNNTADNGGAIYNNGGELTITESTLQENMAKYGGAIHNKEGELTITSSTLTENMAKEDGGAISNYGKLTIEDSTLSKNTVQNVGGAIINGWKGELTITKSTLTENIAEDGGAIYNSIGKLAITNSTLSKNNAHNGGAIHNSWMKSELSIFRCKILNNMSPNNIIFNESFIEVNNTKFYNNKSGYVLVNEYDKFDIGVNSCEFIDNDVEDAVILNNGKNFTIHKTIFENNASTNIINKTNLILTESKIKNDGKTILNEGYILIKNECQKILDQIYGDGEIKCSNIPSGESFDFTYLDDIIQQRKYILYMDKAFIKLNEDIHLENYERDFYEGGIELDIDNLIIDGNGHTIDGTDKSRIFIISGTNITLKNITFKNGYAYDNHQYHFNNFGGAIRINNNINTTIENCEFIKNTAQKSGGAIYNNKGELTITNSTLSKNNAELHGGAIYNNGGELTITESTLQENTASDGGAIYNNGGELTITESTLNNNTAQFSHFSGDGGAIHNHKNCKLTITGSTLSKNNAHNGGAIINYGKLTIKDSTLSENTASNWGGAIHHWKGELTITNSTLSENNAELYGGAIRINEGELTITKSTLAQNTSYVSGAIHNLEGELNITDSALSENIAKNGGGAIYNDDGELTIISSTLTENTAQEGDGGAINNYSKLTITCSTLSGNTAQEGDGGAIHNWFGELRITDCDIKDNKPDNGYNTE